MLLSRLTAELLLKAVLGAAVLIIAGFSFLYSWQFGIVAVAAMAGLNLVSEIYTASCMRTGFPTGLAGSICSLATLGCLIYLAWSASCNNLYGVIAVIAVVIVAALLVPLSMLSFAKPEAPKESEEEL